MLARSVPSHSSLPSLMPLPQVMGTHLPLAQAPPVQARPSFKLAQVPLPSHAWHSPEQVVSVLPDGTKPPEVVQQAFVGSQARHLPPAHTSAPSQVLFAQQGWADLPHVSHFLLAQTSAAAHAVAVPHCRQPVVSPHTCWADSEEHFVSPLTVQSATQQLVFFIAAAINAR